MYNIQSFQTDCLPHMRSNNDNNSYNEKYLSNLQQNVCTSKFIIIIPRVIVFVCCLFLLCHRQYLFVVYFYFVIVSICFTVDVIMSICYGLHNVILCQQDTTDHTLPLITCDAIHRIIISNPHCWYTAALIFVAIYICCIYVCFVRLDCDVLFNSKLQLLISI